MDQIQNSASTPGARAFRRSMLAETSSDDHQSHEDLGHIGLLEPIEARAITSHRPDFEEFLSGISQSLTNALYNQIPATIGACLKQIVEWFDTDRASLLEVDESTGALVISHQWLRSGFTCTKVLGVGTSGTSLERIRKGHMLFLARLDGIPDEGADEIKPLASAGIKSAALIPLSVSNQLCGALSIASFRKHESWDERRVMRLRNVANILAGTVARRRSEARLHSAEARIAEMDEPDKVEHAREEIELSHKHSTVIGQSYEIRGVLRKAEQVAPTNSAVLILGETGTGKELIARTIHELSQRSDRQMVCVNCAAIPATLIESELFGREKGAYTGAQSREIGRFELADRSTIFLDEIGEMPLEVQAKLLRVLQDGEFERLGSSKTIHVNARVIAATNRDLQVAVREGRFREDLYYRLNVFPIEIPPLRERREDIPALAWHTIEKLCKQMGREVESIHPETMQAIQAYSWPGNVRELGNLIERYLILNPGPIFRAEIPRASRPTLLVGEKLEDVERHHILLVLRNTNWRIRGKEGAANILGIKPTTLEARMKKLNINRPQEFVNRGTDDFRIKDHRSIA